MEQNLYAVRMKDGKIRIIQATKKEIETVLLKMVQYIWFDWDMCGRCENLEISELIGKIVK